MLSDENVEILLERAKKDEKNYNWIEASFYLNLKSFIHLKYFITLIT